MCVCMEVRKHGSAYMCFRSESKPTKSATAFFPPSLPNQREGPNKTRQRKIKGMDGEIGGIESLLEGLI